MKMPAVVVLVMLMPFAVAAQAACSDTGSDETCNQEKEDVSALLQKDVGIERSIAEHARSNSELQHSPMPCDICAGTGKGFEQGREIPFWKGRTCNSGELKWACKRPKHDGGKKYLIQWCCGKGEHPDWAKKGLIGNKKPDPDMGKCLCGEKKFKAGQMIKSWDGRTCAQAELDWACKRRESDGGRLHLTRNCCEGMENAPDPNDENGGGGDDGDDIPDCAKDCKIPKDRDVNCADIMKFTGPGGCAADCPDAMKKEHMKHVCGGGDGGKPPVSGGEGGGGGGGRPQIPKCATDCVALHSPPLTCEVFQKCIAPGGCANDCSDKLKRAFNEKVCSSPPVSGGEGNNPPISGGGLQLEELDATDFGDDRNHEFGEDHLSWLGQKTEDDQDDFWSLSEEELAQADEVEE